MRTSGNRRAATQADKTRRCFFSTRWFPVPGDTRCSSGRDANAHPSVDLELLHLGGLGAGSGSRGGLGRLGELGRSRGGELASDDAAGESTEGGGAHHVGRADDEDGGMSGEMETKVKGKVVTWLAGRQGVR